MFVLSPEAKYKLERVVEEWAKYLIDRLHSDLSPAEKAEMLERSKQFLFLYAQLNDEGRAYVEELLAHDDKQRRVAKHPNSYLFQ